MLYYYGNKLGLSHSDFNSEVAVVLRVVTWAVTGGELAPPL